MLFDTLYLAGIVSRVQSGVRTDEACCPCARRGEPGGRAVSVAVVARSQINRDIPTRHLRLRAGVVLLNTVWLDHVPTHPPDNQLCSPPLVVFASGTVEVGPFIFCVDTGIHIFSGGSPACVQCGFVQRGADLRSDNAHFA